MPGSKMNVMNRKETLAAVRRTAPTADFVWDGKEADDRPATFEELEAGVAVYRSKRGRPAGTANKEQVAIRFDREVLEAFRAAGPGWQTRMNEALKDWLRSHTSA